MEVKKITIPVEPIKKEKLEYISKVQKRSLSATLDQALEVYTALFGEDGRMIVSIDEILTGKLFESSKKEYVHIPAVQPVEQQKEEVTGSAGVFDDGLEFEEDDF